MVNGLTLENMYVEKRYGDCLEFVDQQFLNKTSLFIMSLGTLHVVSIWTQKLRIKMSRNVKV